MEKTNWTPPQLLQLSDAYWSTCTLHAAVKLDVFTPLAAETLTAEELATRAGCSARGTAKRATSSTPAWRYERPTTPIWCIRGA